MTMLLVLISVERCRR